MTNLSNNQILSVEQFSQNELELIFKTADILEPVAKGLKQTQILQGAVLANLFFEASTRTRISFGSSFERLGGSVCDTTGFTFSSISKGESLFDTSRVISGYVDVITMRHPEVGAIKEFASATNIPVINAGEGTNEHPTQALLDLYTMQKEFRRVGKEIDKSTVLLFGDLKNGRTVHSLAKILSLYHKIHFVLVSPKSMKLPDDIKEKLIGSGHEVAEYQEFSDEIRDIDLIYATRIQSERYEEGELLEGYSENFRINKRIVDTYLSSDTVILHPLPRDSRPNAYDLSDDLNADPRLAIFRQTDNGMNIRMALFALVMGVEEELSSSLKDVRWAKPKKVGAYDL